MRLSHDASQLFHEQCCHIWGCPWCGVFHANCLSMLVCPVKQLKYLMHNISILGMWGCPIKQLTYFMQIVSICKAVPWCSSNISCKFYSSARLSHEAVKIFHSKCLIMWGCPLIRARENRKNSQSGPKLRILDRFQTPQNANKLVQHFPNQPIFTNQWCLKNRKRSSLSKLTTSAHLLNAILW